MKPETTPPGARSRARIFDGLVVVAIVGISILHYVAPPHAHHLHDIYRRLYYLPIIFGAFRHGWRGGLAAAALVCGAYIPHAFGHISHDPASDTQKILEMVLYFAVGTTTGVLVSRLKRTQSDLQRSIVQLRSTEEQLVHTAKLAAVGRLSAGLAHEIRNPLASIKGSAEILADDFPTGHAKRRLLDLLVGESVRLNEVLTRFLAFARPRSLDRQTFAAEADIAEVLTLLAGQEEGRSIRFDFAGPSAPSILVTADREQFRQVLLNILLNACQASGAGGTVRIRCARSPQVFHLRVEDSGPGFTAEAIENAFTPFFTTKSQGTGLGLAISHRIIEAHGGRIRVMNAAGGGGVVEIDIPTEKLDG